jgi:hypothetical protein
LAITQTMVEPEHRRMKYREALIRAVQTVVKSQLRSEPELIAQLAHNLVNEVDRFAFIQMLTDALSQLHEGNIARYRLRRSEYLAWQT